LSIEASTKFKRPNRRLTGALWRFAPSDADALKSLFGREKGFPSRVYMGVFRRLPSLDPIGSCGRLVGAGAPVAR